MFYDRFTELCKTRGMSPASVTREIGLNNSSSTAWKRGSIPKGDTLQKLADYFGVSVDYLLSGGEQVSQTHLANGVHIYKNTVPFKVVEPFLDSPLADSCDVLYQDEYLLIAVEKESAATDEELQKILDAYVSFNEENAKFLASIKEGEFHTQMNTAFHELNFSGKREAAKRVKELTEIPRYRAETAPQSPPSPQESTDTTPPLESSEGTQKLPKDKK